MCHSYAELREEQEGDIYDLLCDECKAKADETLKGNGRLFDIPMTDYAFCSECVEKIDAYFKSREGD